MTEDYVDDYEGETDLEEAGYLEDLEEEDPFEQDYDQIFAEDAQVDADVEEFEHDSVTGRKAKRPKMSVLNKSKLSKQELDDLFLE